MSDGAKERIAFDVETSRILQILSSEIYDSPKAFLRENLQNAYDAILMRCTVEGTPLSERRIDVTVEGRTLTVHDDGIGMTEEVLKNNFWKAGSSGKKSELAQRSGVIGTFGIGAMANFGVCEALRVETRHIESATTLISSARREDLPHCPGVHRARTLDCRSRRGNAHHRRTGRLVPHRCCVREGLPKSVRPLPACSGCGQRRTHQPNQFRGDARGERIRASSSTLRGRLRKTDSPDV